MRSAALQVSAVMKRVLMIIGQDELISDSFFRNVKHPVKDIVETVSHCPYNDWE